MAEHVDRMETGMISFKILTGKPTGERLSEGLCVDERTVIE